MFRLKVSLKKEFRLLSRDRIGLLFMFLMPVILAIVITSVQNSAFKVLNEHQVTLVICNKDTGLVSPDFISSLRKSGLFHIVSADSALDEPSLPDYIQQQEALAALFIPASYTLGIHRKTAYLSGKALTDFGMQDSTPQPDTVPAIDSLILYFNPVLQESYRYSIKQSVHGVQQSMENKMMIRQLYSQFSKTDLSEETIAGMTGGGANIKEGYLARHTNGIPSNATQHNIPAWTLFAMYFIVISLGGNIVREKLSGSFVRLRILRSGIMINLLSKQVIFLGVVLTQVMIIYSIGSWIFPLLNLPALNLPSSPGWLLAVSVICGMSAISFAVSIGVFASTPEQSNGFGAVSVVILAAVGGVFVPSFAMPEGLQVIMKFSPFYWGLQACYDIFLESGSTQARFMHILPLCVFILILQFSSYLGLRKKGLL